MERRATASARGGSKTELHMDMTPTSMAPAETSASIGPAALCAATAAAFVALAGCFLMGALAIVSPQIVMLQDFGGPSAAVGGQKTLLYVLFAAASSCFAVAIAALTLAYRKLP